MFKMDIHTILGGCKRFLRKWRLILLLFMSFSIWVTTVNRFMPTVSEAHLELEMDIALDVRVSNERPNASQISENANVSYGNATEIKNPENNTTSTVNSHPTENANLSYGNATENENPENNTTSTINSHPTENANVSYRNATENENPENNTTSTINSHPTDLVLCRKVGPDYADYCDLDGDIRVEAITSTIYVVKPNEIISKSWTIKPYVRWYAPNIKNWTVKLMGLDDINNQNNFIPACSINHSNPAILYSMGGFSGNIYHTFSDLLFPLYAISFGFNREVHFLSTDFVWWLNDKFEDIIVRLTKHQVVNIDEEYGQVHCYTKMVAGLKHPNLVIDKSEPEYERGASMLNFKDIIREVYSLQRKMAMENRSIPRLIFISRKKTRVITNQEEISQVASELGFKVVIADPEILTVVEIAQLVNSCDLLMGIHGAGLTNMVFLPENAVLIQILPFGEIDGSGNTCYRDPTAGMGLRYLEYKITTEESSLSQQYSADDPVLTDPMSIFQKGWSVMASVYLENQNITVDLGRFTEVLVQAKKLLQN
uniref:GT61_6 n=1 Tax=Plantago ovata TaxID=185002 RepID=S5RPW5_PLAOV|nr:GT61_6 [Plantago ovata]